MSRHLTVVFILVLAASSSSATTLLGLDTDNPNNSSEVRIRVEVSGPATSVVAFDERVLTTSGSLEVESFGILVDALRIGDMNLAFEGLQEQTTIGVTAIPISLQIDPVTLAFDVQPGESWSTVNPVPGYTYPGARFLDIDLTGAVTLDGVTLPFELYTDPIDCAEVNCYSPTGGPYASTGAFWADALDLVELAGARYGEQTAGFSWPTGGTQTLGTIDGLTVKVSASSALLNAQFGPQVIPEPSTALLLGFGLAGLAVGGRRRAG